MIYKKLWLFLVKWEQLKECNMLINSDIVMKDI